MPELSIKGHFNGTTIVLDEPATLHPGQPVRIVVDPAPVAATAAVEPAFTPFTYMAPTLINGDDWDESAAVHVDPLDRVPPDFVRRPGSAAGQIMMGDDFNQTPEEFGGGS